MTGAEESKTPKRTSGMAIASVVMSSLSIILWPLGFVPGILCGYIAREECRRNPEIQGDKLARIGMTIGYVFMSIFSVAMIVFFVWVGTKGSGQ